MDTLLNLAGITVLFTALEIGIFYVIKQAFKDPEE